MSSNWDNPTPGDEAPVPWHQFSSSEPRAAGGQGFGAFNRGRPPTADSFPTRQWIYVDGLFPPHVRPASVLIGTRGMNHHRMQQSGCTVQLRGKGCSQPTQQNAEDSVHLLVKYDTEEQFEKFKEILSDIVKGYDAQAPRKSRSIQPPSMRPAQMSVPTPPLTTVNINGWDPSKISAATVEAESEFLWLIKVYLVKEQSVFLDELAEGIAVFFCVDSLDAQLAKLSIPPGEHQLREFIRSCPHILKLHLEPGSTFNQNGELPVGSRPRVSLSDNVGSVQKDALKEMHRRVRQEQADAVVPKEDSLPTCPMGLPPASIYGRHDLPLTTSCLILQALHYLISETPESTFVGLEDRFFEKFGLALKVSAWDYPSVVAFVKAHPNIFNVTGTGRDMRVSALQQPDFSSLVDNKSAPSALAAVQAAARAGRLNNTLGSARVNAASMSPLSNNRNTMDEFTRQMNKLTGPLRQGQQQPQVKSDSVDLSWPQRSPITSNNVSLSAAQKAPQLLKLLSKFPRVPMNK